MFIQIIIVNLVIGLYRSTAWQSPERCRTRSHEYQNSNDYSPSTQPAAVSGNITAIAQDQNRRLNQKYKDTKFLGIPTKGHIDLSHHDYIPYNMHVPNSCNFLTHEPRLLSSVYCEEGVACKLAHTVATNETYTSTEGFNWGTRISARVFFYGIFEIGGEASSSGSYTCSFTKSRTMTDNVECTISSAGSSTLQIFNVQSDLECQFSTVTMVPEVRNGNKHAFAPENYFTFMERMHMKSNAIIGDQRSCLVLLNLDRISDALLVKLMKIFPDYNPYTDLVCISGSAYVAYYKIESTAPGIRRVVPFTNEAGDSVFQYACILDHKNNDKIAYHN